MLLIPACLLTLAFLACDDEIDRKPLFTYNPETGKCENNEGTVGFNSLDTGEVRKTKNAECLDLSGMEIIYLLDKAGREGFLPASYSVLHGYDFRGSKFDSARIFFDYVFNADFSGADLRNIQYGYAFLGGDIDQYTLLPLNGQCEIAHDSLYCGN